MRKISGVAFTPEYKLGAALRVRVRSRRSREPDSRGVGRVLPVVRKGREAVTASSASVVCSRMRLPPSAFAIPTERGVARSV